LVTHPERNLVSTGVDSTGSALVMSLLVIFCSVFSVLLLASDDFSIVDGVSAKGLLKTVAHALLELMTVVVLEQLLLEHHLTGLLDIL